jgi:hypothetical protein
MLVHGMMVVTRNVSYFKSTGAAILSPWQLIANSLLISSDLLKGFVVNHGNAETRSLTESRSGSKTRHHRHRNFNSTKVQTSHSLNHTQT